MGMSQLCPILFLYLLLLMSFNAMSFPRRSRSALLREISSNDTIKTDYAVDLNVNNFDDVLTNTSAPFAIVEFYAHWCPACKYYKPHYEKVARLFNGPVAVHACIVLMARMDCALKINSKLCDRFSVSHYPVLFWGPASKFVSGGWEPKERKSEISKIDDGRTADRLLNWINKQLDSYEVLSSS